MLHVKAKVGDRMILCRKYGDPPTECKVIRVTKTQIFVEGFSQPLRLRRSYSDEEIYETSQNASHANVWPWSQDKWEKLILEAETKKERGEERRKCERERQKKYEDRKEKQVKDLFSGDLQNVLFVWKDIMNDGSKIFVLRIPVKTEFIGRKGISEVLIVRIRTEDSPWAMEEDHKTLRVYIARTNNSSGSFSIYSGFDCENEEDGLWRAIRICYNDY